MEISWWFHENGTKHGLRVIYDGTSSNGGFGLMGIWSLRFQTCSKKPWCFGDRITYLGPKFMGVLNLNGLTKNEIEAKKNLEAQQFCWAFEPRWLNQECGRSILGHGTMELNWTFLKCVYSPRPSQTHRPIPDMIDQLFTNGPAQTHGL
jgi:hypothetical protein